MDLGAYAQIGNFSEIAKENDIDSPRLRGYRLMSEEQRVTQESIDELKKDCEIDVAKSLCVSEPFWDPNSYGSWFSAWTDRLKDYYLVKNPHYRVDDDYQEYIGIRWDRIHGWKRRILKFEIKKQKKRIQKSMDTFNKYVGRNDVLYIHARIGGNNWVYFGGPEKVASQPWFLEKVDDYFDSTYCDIYARIKPVRLEEKEEMSEQ